MYILRLEGYDDRPSFTRSIFCREVAPMQFLPHADVKNYCSAVVSCLASM